VSRRERWSILGAILLALEEELQRGEEARLSNVATRANLPYDRLVAYLTKLQAGGLLTEDKPPRITEKGREFLRHYRQWVSVLDRFGVDQL